MTDHKFAPLFPLMWAREGEKCLHEQRRMNRITLVCAKLKGHLGSHLHDVHPDQQVKA